MRGLSLLKKKWVLALLALVAIMSGLGVYRWYAGRSLGIDGRKDYCAAAVEAIGSAGAYGIPVTNASPQAMKTLLSAQPLPVNMAGLTESPIPGTPVLVHPIHMHTGADANDCPHWLVPFHDDAGHLVAMTDYVYAYPHKLVRFSNAGRIFPGELRYSNPFPYLSSDQAIAVLKRARGVGTLREPAPELVFLPLDVGVPGKPGLAWGWRGGGVVPDDPVWLLAGADGQDYVIGTDKHAYTLHDVPLS